MEQMSRSDSAEGYFHVRAIRKRHQGEHRGGLRIYRCARSFSTGMGPSGEENHDTLVCSLAHESVGVEVLGPLATDLGCVCV